jgi:hypothetical protein
MTAPSRPLFGKRGLPGGILVAGLVFAVVFGVDAALLSILPSGLREVDARRTERAGRRPDGGPVQPPAAATVQTTVDLGFEWVADRESLALYDNLVRFRNLKIEVGQACQIVFARERLAAATPPGSVQTTTALSSGEIRPAAPP